MGGNYQRTAENTAWMREPWTCPTCKIEFPRSAGKGTHLKWCGQREEHFWSKVNKTPTCWLYEGTISFEGYGYVNIGTAGVRRQQWQAHRFAWTLLNGPIPEGGCLLHHCDVRNCVNPAHLYIGDRKDNARDRFVRKRDTGSDLSYDQVLEIKAALVDYKHGMCKQLALKYGVSATVVSDIKMGKTFQHITPPNAAGGRDKEEK